MNSRTPLPTTLEELQSLCLDLQAKLQNQSEQLAVQSAKLKIKDSALKSKDSELKSKDKELITKDKELSIKNAALEEKENTIEYLQEQLLLLRSKRFKSQSETLKAVQGQLFDEAELEQAIRETEQALAEAQEKAQAEKDKLNEQTPPKPKPPKQEKPKRKALPAHLKRVEIEVDVSAEDKQAMGADWALIGYDTSEQLAVRQREYYVKQIKRAKYVRKKPSKSAEEQAQDQLQDGIKVASRPDVILPKSLADASLLADVLASKFIDGMSFYRTDKRLQREGIDIGYSTLCDWPIQLLERLKPLQNLFYEQLAQSQLWHLDETTLQVLQEKGRTAHQKSYLWAIRGGPPDQPIVAFHYSPHRSYEALAQWLDPCLSEFSGSIVTDEYGAYNLLKKNHPNIKAHGGCLAHCRRKFTDAAKHRNGQSDAHKVLQKIAIIYRLEQQTEGYTGKAKKDLRHELLKPELDKLKSYLEALAPKYIKKGNMKKAISYALNHWDKFTAFIEHPELPIDNNPIEQAIRPFTIGRKNWLFAGSPRGADASAWIYSLVETAKANGLEPKAYLTELFTRLPRAKTQEEMRELLPMYFKIEG